MNKKAIISRIAVVFSFVVATAACARHAPSQQAPADPTASAPIDAEALDRFLEREMEAADIPGLSIAVIEDGQLAYRRALGTADRGTDRPITDRTLFEAASLSKPLFAYFVMKQVEKGVIDLDTPLYSYLPNPDLAFDERYKRITARMVLAHTSGLPNWRRDNPDGKLDIAFAPGTDYRYSGEGYQYLKDVLAHLLGTDDDGLERVFQREVAKPLGADRLYFTWNAAVARHKATGHRAGQPTDNGPEDNVGLFGAAYSLHTEAGDYARFLIALMRQEGLREATRRTMLSEAFRFPPDHPEAADGTTGRSLGFSIAETPDGPAYAHGGNNGDFQGLALFLKEKDDGVVVLSNTDDLFASGFADRLLAFLAE